MDLSPVPPRSVDEVQKLINNKVMEGLQLDYKRSPALPGKQGEVAKDISAFANSAGGTLIYGVAEDGNLPTAIDGGVDHKECSRERLESIIQTNVSPVLDELSITQIPLNEERSIFVVSVPRSPRAPHQARHQKCYYKRYNFQSVAMEDYEINDVRNRRVAYPPLLLVDAEIEQGVFLNLFVENISDLPAQQIHFHFQPELHWPAGEPPLQFSRGISVLPPRKRLSIPYGSVYEAFDETSNLVKAFSVSTTYFHPGAAQRVTEKLGKC